MYRVLLFSDSRYRDSFGSALIKHNLDKHYRNILTQVASFNYWQLAVEAFAPHVVVLNHMQGERNKMIARRIKNNGGIVVVQFNEGLLEFANKRPIFEMQRGSELVDSFLCWNQETADIVNGVAIGNPRFDIYGKYRNLIASPDYMKSKLGIPADKKVIVFGSSFPSGKFTYMLQNFHRNNWRELGNTLAKEWGDPDDFAEGQARYQKEFKSIILAAATTMSEDYHIAVAPHPMSDINMWRSFCEEYDLTMLHGNYIFDILSTADVYVGKLGSVTVGESWLMNKPTIKFDAGYRTASSEEQLYGYQHDGQGNIVRVEETAKNYPGLRSDAIVPYIEMALKNAKLTHDEYLKKWGIYPLGAGEKTAQSIANLLAVLKPTLLTEDSLNLTGLAGGISSHDKTHGGYYVDSYGNHNKAVRQSDINHWLHLIREIDA